MSLKDLYNKVKSAYIKGDVNISKLTKSYLKDSKKENNKKRRTKN